MMVGTLLEWCAKATSSNIVVRKETVFSAMFEFIRFRSKRSRFTLFAVAMDFHLTASTSQIEYTEVYLTVARNETNQLPIPGVFRRAGPIWFKPR